MMIKFLAALFAFLFIGSHVQALDRIRISVSNPNMPGEVADLTFLREAQAELGIKGR